MEGSKCIISIKTHDLVTFKGTNLPVLDGDTVLLYNRQANCVVRAPLTKSIRDIFKIAEKERHEETVVEDDYEAVEEEEDAIMQKEMGETIKQTEETITELLIVEYSNRPPLHNERLPITERSRSIKKSLELEVYNALGGQMSLADIPKKWCYLKKEYKKQKTLLNKYVQSGCSYEEAAKVTGKTLWKHFLSMRFIDDHIDERKQVTNISEPLQTSYSSNDMFAPPPSPNNTLNGASKPSTSNASNTSGNRKRKVDATDNLDKLIVEEIKKNEMDSTDHFCRALAFEMKKLDERKRALLQINFLQLLNRELFDK